MERGLLWLPLLGVFIGLAWAGWNEYRKLAAYQNWAVNFDRAKYDIYAVLGQKEAQITWGVPTRQGPIQVQTVSLMAVEAIALYGQAMPLPPQATVPRGCQTAIGLQLTTGEIRLIPFTDEALADRWQKQLQALLQALKSTPHASLHGE